MPKNISLFKRGFPVILAVLCGLTPSFSSAAPPPAPDARALSLLRGAIAASEAASPLIADLTVREKGPELFSRERTLSLRVIRQKGGAARFLSSSPKATKQEKDWAAHLSGEDSGYNPFLSHIPGFLDDPKDCSLTYAGKEKKDGTQYDVVEMDRQSEDRALGEVHQSVTKWYVGSDGLVHRISSSQVTLYTGIRSLGGGYSEVKWETALTSLYARAAAADLAALR